MKTSDRLELLGVANKSFLIQHPRMTDAFQRMEILRKIGRKTVGKPQKVLPVIGPTRSGKTKNLLAWCEEIAAKEKISQGAPHPILLVTLQSKATIKTLGTDILHALGKHGLPVEVVADLLGRQSSRRVRAADPFAKNFEAQIMYAAATALQLAGVELLAVDEIHHLIHTDGATKTAWSVSEALKVLVDSGVCPVVIIGINKSRRIISAKNNPQFALRCETPLILNPIDPGIPEDLEFFAGYVIALGQKYFEAGIFPKPQDLTREDFLACFYDVSKGVIGVVSELTEKAAECAIRRGAEAIGREDFSLATRQWAMSLEITEHDPWRLKPRDFQLIRTEAAQVLSQ